MLRRKLAQAKEKLTLIAIGPLTNIARLIKSEGDIYSDLNGTDALRKRRTACISWEEALKKIMLRKVLRKRKR